MRYTEFRPSAFAIERSRDRHRGPAPALLTDERARADAIPAKRLRDVAAANRRTAARPVTSAYDSNRLERQASNLLSISARLAAANDNRQRRAAA